MGAAPRGRLEVPWSRLWPDKAGVEFLDVMLRTNPSFDTEEYSVTRLNALAVFPPGLPQAWAGAQRVQGAPCAASPAFPLA